MPNAMTVCEIKEVHDTCQYPCNVHDAVIVQDEQKPKPDEEKVERPLITEWFIG